MTKGSQRRLLRRDERRAQILGAAAAAFVDRGFSATSIDDVAAAAGITKVIVYRHFEGKAELYRAVLDQVAASLAEAFEPGGEGRSGPVSALLHAARADPEGFRLLTVHAAREAEFESYAAEVRTAMLDTADEVIRPLVEDAALRAWLDELLVASAVGSVLAWLDHGPVDRDDEFLDRTTAALRGMVEGALVPGTLRGA